MLIIQMAEIRAEQEKRVGEKKSSQTIDCAKENDRKFFVSLSHSSIFLNAFDERTLRTTRY